MNIIKVQQELIKKILQKNERIPYFEDENNFYVFPNNYYFIKIEKDKMYVNLSFSALLCCEEEFISEREHAVSAFTNNEVQKIGKHICIKFYYGNKKELFVDKKYLDCFKSECLSYRASEETLFIYEFTEFVGAIHIVKIPKLAEEQ